MKFGVSFAITTPLPRCRSAKSRHAFDDRGIGRRRRNDLDEVQVSRRVEEVRAEPVTPEAVRCAPRRASPIGMPDVFDVTIVPAPRTASTRSSSARLMSSRSTTASITQSRPPSRGQVGVEAAGRDERRRLRREERIRLERAGAVRGRRARSRASGRAAAPARPRWRDARRFGRPSCRRRGLPRSELDAP